MDIWTSLGAFAFFESERLSFRPLVFLDRFDLHEICLLYTSDAADEL